MIAIYLSKKAVSYIDISISRQILQKYRFSIFYDDQSPGLDDDHTLIMTTMMNKTVDMASCSPEELASFLLQDRFTGNAADTKKFLHETLQIVEKGSTTSSPVKALTTDLGKKLDDIPPLEVSCTVPRSGKVMIQLYEKGLVATKKDAVVWSASNDGVDGILQFPKPEDLKQKRKVVSQVLLLHSQTNTLTTFKDKPYQQICLTLPPCSQEDEASASTPAHLWTRALSQRVLHKSIDRVSMDRPVFSSFVEPGKSTTTGGLPFVSCYQGTKDGVLFPLRQGLLFWSPPRFWSRQGLHSIAAGRGNGGSSRYVDVQVTLAEDNGVEFTNIDRSELAGLNQYIHRVLIPAMHQDAGEDPQDGNDADDNNGDQTNNHPQADEEEETTEDDEGPTSGTRRRGKRKAGQEARQAIRKRVTSQPNADESDYDEDEDLDFQHDDDDDEEGASDESDSKESRGLAKVVPDNDDDVMDDYEKSDSEVEGEMVEAETASESESE